MTYQTRFRIVAVLFVVVLLMPAVLAQQSLIVPAKGGTVSVLDLETLNLEQTLNVTGLPAYAAVGNNPRLAYVGGANGNYLSVVDFTIGREINRIYDVCPWAMPAFTSDRQYLLVEDQCDSSVKVLDTSTQKLVRKLDLAPYMGTGAQGQNFGSIVVLGQKAYVTTGLPDSSRPAIAVVDLQTFKIKAIPTPAGYFEIFGYWSPNAAATPDGKYVVMVQTSPDGMTFHLLFISTATDQLVMDKTLTFDPMGLLITPVNSPGNVYGYLLGIDIDGQFSAALIDLNDGSPTFGQILTESEVVLQSYFAFDFSAVLNPEGTRLVVGRGKNGQSSPNPNVVVIDTTQMLHNPGGAIKGTAIVANGLNVHGMAIATITSTPPLTAPTVTSVTSSIVNDKDSLIKVTGTNFAPGAMVRVGTTPPLPAKVDNSTTLHVTVPQNWPAQAKLDVVVTNPNMKMPPAQQYQSGLLAEQFTILPTSDFQPNHQFAAFVVGDYSVAVYEPNQQTMIDVPNTVLPNGITFNRDGKEIYSAGLGTRGLATPAEAAAWSPSDGMLQAETPFSAGSSISVGVLELTLAASVNPFTGKPVVFVPLRTRSGSTYDVTVEMIDTDASSPAFNQVILTISAGLGLNASAHGGTATPDGKYVYVNYYYFQSGIELDFIGIFDVVHGTVTSISTNTLRVAPIQYEMTVTPDGQSLLMTPLSMTAISSTAPIAVFDISTNPLRPTLVTTIHGTSPTRKGFYFQSWKVVGNRLFALDGNSGIVVAFNFDRKNLNFSQLGLYMVGHPQNLGEGIGVSPDGALIYIPIAGYDMLAVLDANKLVHGHSPLITNIGAFRSPYQVTVSPATIYSGQ
jgi:hypothetical protein